MFRLRTFGFHTFLAACLAATATVASAQDAETPPAAPVLAPSLTGPLAANPAPYKIDTGVLGTAYVTGIVSGLGMWQSNAVSGDHRWTGDLSNGQIFVQKIDGLFQYYVQAGIYDLPSLGTPYVKATRQTDSLYGPVPQAYIKLAPTDNLSVMFGKMPTLIGAENTFTFQNRNIERGLLWNQTPGVNRALQVNYTQGPLAVSVSWSDGFYSDRWTWLAGSATYTIDSANAVTLIAGGNLGRTDYSSAAVPLAQNNQQIYTLVYTLTAGAWTLQPSAQVSKVPRLPALGLTQDAATYSGSIWAQYAFSPNFSVPVRLEYISTTGTLAAGAPNLLYGPGSRAWSATLTPTVQVGRLFARLEGSYVKATRITPGAAFGPSGNAISQTRLLVEAGVMF